MNLPARYDPAPDRLADLIQRLRERENPVVVLVDEYDKPIVDALETPELARANRNFLRGLYSTLKSVEAHIRFTFFTGVRTLDKTNGSLGAGGQQDVPAPSVAKSLSLERREDDLSRRRASLCTNLGSSHYFVVRP